MMFTNKRYATTSQRGHSETLEQRRLLAAMEPPLQPAETSSAPPAITDEIPEAKAGLVADVDGDGELTPRDLLVLVNALNARAEVELNELETRDVNNDGQFTARDALWVVNALNAPQATEATPIISQGPDTTPKGEPLGLEAPISVLYPKDNYIPYLFGNDPCPPCGMG